MSKEDKAEAQRNRVEKELAAMSEYAARMTVTCLLRAIENREGIDWAQFAKAAQFAGGVDAMRAARDINDGNESRYHKPF